MALAAVKRRRLQELVGIGGVSDSALARILENLRQNAIQAPVSRQACNRASLAAIRDVEHKLAIPLVKGGTWDWHILLFHQVLRKSLATMPAVAAAFRSALRRRPSNPVSPWRLVCYFDELTPGQALRPDNKRKTMAVYASFAELGPQLLCRSEFWFTIAVARTDIIRQVEGGWSRMLRDLLRTSLLGEASLPSGVVLHIGEPTLFFARLSNIIADEAALKAALDCKGSSGLRCCPGCRNVMLRGSDLASRCPSGYLVEITCSDIGKFDFATDEDIFGAVDLLARSKGTLGVGAFAQLERSAGFNHNPNGLLADLQLRSECLPATCLTFDPMHCLWSNGVVSVEVHCFLDRMQSGTKFTWRELQAFCRAEWEWPRFCRAKGRAIHEVFNESREKSSKESFKAGATELLVVLPLLLHFAETFLVRSLPDEVRCLRAMATVAHECQEAKFGRGDADKLAAAVSRHLACFRLVYSEDMVKPKHHYLFHLPRQLARDTFLLDAFTLERKHQEVKRAASNTDNTAEYEVSTLARVHVDEMRNQSQLECDDGLRGPRVRYEPLAAILADALEYRGLRVHVGDIVFQGRHPVRVVGAMLHDDHGPQLLVHSMHFCRRLSEVAAVWKSTQGLCRCSPEGLRHASCWCTEGDELVILRL